MTRLFEEVRSAAAQYVNGELTHEVITNLPFYHWRSLVEISTL